VGARGCSCFVTLSAIADRREQRSDNAEVPAERCAYILRSLKHPGEVERLRSVYGRRFFLIAAYAPREVRVDALAEGIAASHHSMQPTEFLDNAYRLVQRDEAEIDRPLGQNVRDTFHQADFFIDAQYRQRMESELARIVEIVFGHPFRTPTRDEQAMFLAEAAAMRSAEMGRQVGAVIATDEGDVVSVGTNDVPKAGGGLYWEGDAGDSRIFSSERTRAMQ
jgi:deoxycytidylate deaminase